MTLSILSIIAQAQPATPAPASQLPSVLDFALKGGPVMIPIAIFSLVGLAVLVERLVKLRRRVVLPPGLVDQLRPLLEQRGDTRAAVQVCQTNPSPLARVLSVGIRRLGEPEEALTRHIQEAGEREIPILRSRLRMLAVIASVAPLLGLLGTILGMITAFKTVAASGDALGRTELLAQGIYEAMITTAAGLVVAIPALIAYHWLSSRVELLVAEIDRVTVEFIEEFGVKTIASRPTAAPQSAAPAPKPTGDPTDGVLTPAMA